MFLHGILSRSSSEYYFSRWNLGWLQLAPLYLCPLRWKLIRISFCETGTMWCCWTAPTASHVAIWQRCTMLSLYVEAPREKTKVSSCLIESSHFWFFRRFGTVKIHGNLLHLSPSREKPFRIVSDPLLTFADGLENGLSLRATEALLIFYWDLVDFMQDHCHNGRLRVRRDSGRRFLSHADTQRLKGSLWENKQTSQHRSIGIYWVVCVFGRDACEPNISDVESLNLQGFRVVFQRPSLLRQKTHIPGPIFKIMELLARLHRFSCGCFPSLQWSSHHFQQMNTWHWFCWCFGDETKATFPRGLWTL